MSARRQLLFGTGLLLGLGCSTAPLAPTGPKPWRPDPGPELLAHCQGAGAVTCRGAAEQLAAQWTTDEEAFGAAKAFSAACLGGDAPACTALDTRFQRPRHAGPGPATPGLPINVYEHNLEGDWAALCHVDLEGRASQCQVVQSLPMVDTPFVGWVLSSKWSPASVDGRPFACEYRIEVQIRVADR